MENVQVRVCQNPGIEPSDCSTQNSKHGLAGVLTGPPSLLSEHIISIHSFISHIQSNLATAPPRPNEATLGVLKVWLVSSLHSGSASAAPGLTDLHARFWI